MILVHQDRYRSLFGKGANQGGEFVHSAIVKIYKVGLNHHGRVFELGRLDDRARHLEVANIERWHAKTIFEDVSKKYAGLCNEHKLILTRHHKSNDLIVVRLRDQALPDFFATAQNQYPIANLKNVVQIVRNENHSYAALFKSLDYFHDLPLLRHAQSRRRFIH